MEVVSKEEIMDTNASNDNLREEKNSTANRFRYLKNEFFVWQIYLVHITILFCTFHFDLLLLTLWQNYGLLPDLALFRNLTTNIM